MHSSNFDRRGLLRALGMAIIIGTDCRQLPNKHIVRRFRMTTTPVSLLFRLKSAKPDAIEWTRFEDLYRPLIAAWLARVPGLGDEVSDVSQEVFSVLIRELPHFDRRREGSFRAWLRKVTINRTRAFLKKRHQQPHGGVPDAADGFLDQLEDQHSDLSSKWNSEHDQQVFQKLLASIETEFTPTTLVAFQRCAIGGQSAVTVAAELGISENAVFLAKSRVLKRLRDEAAGLID